MGRKGELPTTPVPPTPSPAEHGRAANEAVEQHQREPKRSHRRPEGRGLPPPPEFDFGRLADSTLLNEHETAAVLRVHMTTLQAWRSRGVDALPWVEMAHGIRYRVTDIRAYLALPRTRKYPIPPRRPRRADRRAEELTS
jgi:hypothetical protein